MNTNLSIIMRKAHGLRKNFGLSMSEALKMAWAQVRGEKVSFVAPIWAI